MLGLVALLLLAYCVAPADRFTLAATRGAAGAVRTMVPAALDKVMPQRQTIAKSRQILAQRAKPVGTSPACSKKAAPKLERRRPSFRELAAAGWRDGVSKARTRRAAEADLWSRGRRLVGRSRALLDRIVARPATRRETPSITETAASPTEQVPTHDAPTRARRSKPNTLAGGARRRARTTEGKRHRDRYRH
jgi:hypothetical protein